MTTNHETAITAGQYNASISAGPTHYRSNDGTRTATHDRETNTLTVFVGVERIAEIPTSPDVTPGEIWNLIRTAGQTTETVYVPGETTVRMLLTPVFALPPVTERGRQFRALAVGDELPALGTVTEIEISSEWRIAVHTNHGLVLNLRPYDMLYVRATEDETAGYHARHAINGKRSAR